MVINVGFGVRIIYERDARSLHALGILARLLKVLGTIALLLHGRSIGILDLILLIRSSVR